MFILLILSDLLDTDGDIPQAFCYVPDMDQINKYKQYKKILDSNGRDRKNLVRRAFPNLSGIERLGGFGTSSSLRQNPTATTSSQEPPHLMTLQEFLLTSSSSTAAVETGGESHDSHVSSRCSSQQTLDSGLATPQQASESPSRVMSSSRFIASLENLIERYERASERTNTEITQTNLTTLSSSKKEIVEYTDQDFDVNGRTSYNVWEHVCLDKIWENVLEYYYSTCATSKERKKQCLQLNGIDISQPENPRNLAQTLLFQAGRKSEKLKCVSGGSSKRKREQDSFPPTTTTIVADGMKLTEQLITSECRNNISLTASETPIYDVVKEIVGELVDKVVCSPDTTICHASNVLEDEQLNSCRSTTTPEEPCKNKSLLKDSVVNKRDANSVKKRPQLPMSSKTPTSPQEQKHGRRNKLVNIDTDTEMTKRLSTAPSSRWTRKHDLGLIDYMVTLRKRTESESMVLCLNFVVVVVVVILLNNHRYLSFILPQWNYLRRFSQNANNTSYTYSSQ